MAFEDNQFHKAVKESECPDLNGWDLLVETHGVKVYRLYRSQSKLYEYKVIGNVEIKAELCAAVYMDIAYRKLWDSYVKELTYIRKTEPEIIYWEVAFPWPMSNRDYVYLRQQKKMVKNDRRIWAILGRSAKSKDLSARHVVDEKKGVIRVNDYEQCMVIIDNENKTSQIYMHYYDDPKGMIPSVIVNWAAKTGVPGFLTSLRDACRNYKKDLPC